MINKEDFLARTGWTEAQLATRLGVTEAEVADWFRIPLTHRSEVIDILGGVNADAKIVAQTLRTAASRIDAGVDVQNALRQAVRIHLRAAED